LIQLTFPRGELDVAHRSIGQERFGFAGRAVASSSLDELSKLIDWVAVAAVLDPLYSGAKGEPAWPPLAMFKALLLSIWYDLSDVKLAEALDDRASFRRFCGFSANEATPERTAFVRYRRLLVAHKLDRSLFDTVTTQLKSKAVTVKTGTLVDATIIASASEDDDDARWVKHKGSALFMASKPMLVPIPTQRWSRKYRSPLPISMMVKQALMRCLTTLAKSLPTVPTAAIISVTPSEQRGACRGSLPLAHGVETSRKHFASSANGTNRSIVCVAGSKRSSGHGSARTAYAECDGEAS
jgi:IS5 family transposase